MVEAIPASELEEGDLVVVYPGEMISVDGEIVDGHATIDQKTITGEGLPVNRGVGETAFAATVIRDGQITVRALRVGSATTAGQIVHLVESAPIGDTRMQNHAEHFADRLVTPTLGLAAGTAAMTGDFNRFLSLVIVDYGTGIRVAAPTSVLSSMTHAARAGIIIKSGGHMEKLAGIDTVVFDKTGTLTHGTPAVIDVIPYQDHITPGHLLGLAAAAETRLQHPVAEALARSRAGARRSTFRHATKPNIASASASKARSTAITCMSATSASCARANIKVDAAALDRTALDEKGYSCLYIAVDGKLAGLVPFSDEIRAESRPVIQQLHAMGIKNTVMLTGDNGVVARAVCNEIGLTQHFADMLPADKASIIQQMQREGRRVAMVGDGINNSPALEFRRRRHRHEARRRGHARVRRYHPDGRFALEAGQGGRNLARRGSPDQAELRDRRRPQHAGAGAGAAGRTDHARGHGADQQRLGDPCQHERDTSHPALSVI